MAYKVRGNSSYSVITRIQKDYDGRETTASTDFWDGTDSITYSDGPKVLNGMCNWKDCVHTSQDVMFGGAIVGGFVEERNRRDQTQSFSQSVYAYPKHTSLLPDLPAGEWDAQCVANCLSQLDLNSSENVLLYSGILQAVPLVGSVFKLTSILNRAAKKMSKSFRKKPFTTALKTLISLDFIDRFVISPTIDDARRFADATNYVLRVLETARERNAHRFAISNEVRSSTGGTWSSGNRSAICSGRVIYTPESRTGSLLSSKAYIILEAKYDMMAIDPIKFWAQRVGLTTPLDSMWDLIPFSFVVDYFTRAGDMISGLSHEMSKIDGLEGRITRIVDAWYTFTRRSYCERRVLNAEHVSPSPSWHAINTMILKGNGGRQNVSFERHRIPNIFASLNQLEKDPMINWKLSSIRKRTIAELVIQAKL